MLTFIFVSLLFGSQVKYSNLEAVRLRDANLNRIDCSAIDKGTALRVLAREKLAGQADWWLKVQTDKCESTGYVREKATSIVPEIRVLGDPRVIKNPNLVEEMLFLAGHGSHPPKKELTRARGLYRFPIRANTLRVGACGSYHYNPDSVDLVDSYINSKVGCNFLSLLQEWRKTECPTRQLGCRIAWGDISHKIKLRWNGHRTHTYGYCMDLRPLRKGGFKNAPLWYQHAEYDGVATEKLIRLLRDHGATTLKFNDPKIINKGLSKYARGHDNHIHVCFKNKSVSDKICRDYSFDKRACENLANGDMH